LESKNDDNTVKKIIFFTTSVEPKNKESKIILEASFSSWKKLGVEVLVYCEENQHSIATKYGFKLVSDFKKDTFGVPIVKSLFNETHKNYNRDFYVYLNSDIIIEEKLINIINQIELDEFMLLGRRKDIFGAPKVNYIKQSIEDIYFNLKHFKFEVHNELGIDYFAYTKGFWDLSKMPKFRIARARFDHWLTGFALSQQKPVIDISKVYQPIHFEPNDRLKIDWISLLMKSRIKFYQFLLNRLYILFDNYNANLGSLKYYLVENNSRLFIIKK
jgi:hypothetical protein